MWLYSDEMEWYKLMGQEGTREKEQQKKKIILHLPRNPL